MKNTMSEILESFITIIPNKHCWHNVVSMSTSSIQTVFLELILPNCFQFSILILLSDSPICLGNLQ